MERLEENVSIYIEALGGEEQAVEKVKLTAPYQNVPRELFRNYNELCRGEKVEVRIFNNF